MAHFLFNHNGLRAVAIGTLVTALSACGGSDVEVQSTPLPPPTEQPVVNYTGPAASTDDVANFKRALWDNIATADRCGACHTQGVQTPTFARNDDINLAYADTGALVDLAQPSESRLVTKVAGGHNCWLTSDSACADIMTTWISDWASDSDAQNQATEIELQAPVARAPGSTKNFPESPALLRIRCIPYCKRIAPAVTPIVPPFLFRLSSHRAILMKPMKPQKTE